MGIQRPYKQDSELSKQKRRELRGNRIIQNANWFARKTPQELDDYVDANVANIGDARQLLKKVIRLVHALSLINGSNQRQ